MEGGRVRRAAFWSVVFLACAPGPGAQAVFQQQDESSTMYNQVMDEKERQEEQAKYKALKAAQARSEAEMRQQNRSQVKEFFQKLGVEAEEATDWKNLNRWLMNLTFIGIVGALAWYGWRFNQSRER
jgi:DNA-binding transcriptional regulator GbsR (MarR family)